MALVACSSSTGDTEETTAAISEASTTVAATTTTVSPSAAALPYFEALAKQTRVGYDIAARMSTGPAKEYAKYMNEHLQAVAFAEADGRTFGADPLQTATVDESGRVIVESEDNRISYSNFQFFNKMLIGFDVEGRPLGNNLKSNLPFQHHFYFGFFQIKHAYVSAAGDLILTYEVSIDSDATYDVREDSKSGGLPSHVLVGANGGEIEANWSIETFARGETRTNVVSFGPLPGGDYYEVLLKVWEGGHLRQYRFKLGDFLG